jgi:hypothetical protein
MHLSTGCCITSWCPKRCLLLLFHCPQAAALLQRHPRVEQLDLSALQGPAEQGGADGTVGFVQQIAPHLTRCVLTGLSWAAAALCHEHPGTCSSC